MSSTSNGKAGIEVGDRADLCIIDLDPLSATAKEFRRVKIGGTMLGGRWTHFAL
jgi:predicted amidohydrolase YtcJ